MGSKRLMEKLDADVKILEDKIQAARTTAKPAEPSADGQPAQGTTDATTDNHPDATGSENWVGDAIVDGQAEPQGEPTKPRESWELRFKNLKAYHDTEIYKLRKQAGDFLSAISSLQSENQQLRQQIADLLSAQPKRSIKETLTPDELDQIGEQEVDIVERIVNKRIEDSTKDLKEQLSKAEQREAERIKAKANEERQASYRIFLDKLAALVPDFMVLDKDVGFNTWLKDVDPASGFTRIDLFRQAEQSGDVGRVAQFFVEYKKKLRKPQENLAKRVTPVGGASGNGELLMKPSQPDNNIISMAEYKQFIDDCIKGRFKGRRSEEQALEEKFNRAMREGRLR